MFDLVTFVRKASHELFVDLENLERALNKQDGRQLLLLRSGSRLCRD